MELALIDSRSGEPLPYASLRLRSSNGTVYTQRTDSLGRCIIHGLPEGGYDLRISYVGYQALERKLWLRYPSKQTLRLSEAAHRLADVVITATESQGSSTSSRIGREAMTHLQPSSFADLLELLPGGRSRIPRLTLPNAIHLREVATSDERYATTSLGVSFLVDGLPLQQDASLQGIDAAAGRDYSKRNFSARGVDLRSISTDDIASVEIIRGIPSVEYGQLTSGLVKIQRKRDLEQLEARFKADLGSKLYYLGGGTNRLGRGFNLSASLDLLDAQSDPRNPRENYLRLGGSLRTTKLWHWGQEQRLEWQANIDYSSNVDRDKKDPELNYGQQDDYRASSTSLALGSSLNWERGRSHWLRELSLDLSLRHSHERTEITRFVQLSQATLLANALEPGSYQAKWLPYTYTTDYSQDGRPVTFYTKLKGRSAFTLGKLSMDYLWGLEQSWEANLGQGERFDLERPLYGGGSSRPRRFDEVPALNSLMGFLEGRFDLALGQHKLRGTIGLRSETMLGLNQHYAMYGRLYTDPRASILWSLPSLKLAGKPLGVKLYAGIGWHSRRPTLAQLYPEKRYFDIVELNYWHERPELRSIWARTYRFDGGNPQLEPARNLKQELRLDLNWQGYSLSLTAFDERLRNGFRPESEVHFLPYRRYSTEQLNHSQLSAAPSPSELPYSDELRVALLDRVTGGSATYKRGLELFALSPRYRQIATRFTLTAAYFHTTYHNSTAQYRHPQIQLAGRTYPYVGIYEELEGTELQSLRSTLSADTYLPRLGFTLSLSLQSLWLSRSQSLPHAIYPSAYLDLAGQRHPYTEADRSDSQLQWLRRRALVASQAKTPFECSLNLKASKRLFAERAQVALFVNNILEYRPSYEVEGVTMRRHGLPYFGMELNYRL